MPRRDSSLAALFGRGLLALLALALAYPLVLAVRNGWADLYAEPAKSFLQDSRDAGVTLSEAQWQAIHANLQRALSLTPHDPVTLTELGRLHRIQLESDTLAPAEIERHGHLALGYYEQAALRRPAWPWGWSNSALVRYELYQDKSAAYQQALINAAYFGPWEGQVERVIIDLGLDTWATLSSAAQQAVLASVDRALKRQPEGLAALVNAAQGWQTLCQAAARASAAEPRDRAADELSRLRQYCAGMTRE